MDKYKQCFIHYKIDKECVSSWSCESNVCFNSNISYISRAHTNILRHCSNVIPRLSVMSRFVKMSPSVLERNKLTKYAFYLVSGLSLDGIRVKPTLFTKEQTQWFLDNGHITIFNLLGYIPYDLHFAKDAFKEFVELVLDAVEDKTAKKLINNLVGYFGRHKQEHTTSFLTNSEEYANAMALDYAKRTIGEYA